MCSSSLFSLFLPFTRSEVMPGMWMLQFERGPLGLIAFLFNQASSASAAFLYLFAATLCARTFDGITLKQSATTATSIPSRAPRI